MSNTKNPIFSAHKLHRLSLCDNNKPVLLYQNPENISSVMWRNVARQAILRSSSLNCNKPFSRAYSFLGFSQDSIFLKKCKFGCLGGNHELVSRPIGEIFSHEVCLGKPCFGVLKNDDWGNGLCLRGYASVAEAVSSTDVEEDASVVDEIQELLQEMKREEHKEGVNTQSKRKRFPGVRKYQMLKRRQVKIETEAWEKAAKEYKELLRDMCEQKLAPNLPYIKSLFLGWFEPMRDAIVMEQERCRIGKNRRAYDPYFDQLPADKMAVITMHKLMGLLMTGGEHGRARVVQTACVIGDAIEQEVGEIYCYIQ